MGVREDPQPCILVKRNFFVRLFNEIFDDISGWISDDCPARHPGRVGIGVVGTNELLHEP